MKKIAIIGSGFFGLGAALVLSKKYNIDLFENKKDILQGVSSSNQLRFHLGYHYPRSPETLREVQKNNKDFIKFYSNNIFGKTKNYYGVSCKNSLTSYKKYIEFLKKNKLKYKKIKLNEIDSVQGTILSEEKNLNIFKIKKKIKQKIFNSRINLRLNSNFKKEDLKKYYKVIIATYENNNLILKKLGVKPKRKYKFELVEKTVIKLPKHYRNKSYMIIDGKFFCLDPYLGTRYHLLSSNKYSKIEIVKSLYPNFKSKKLNLVNNGLIKDLKYSRFLKIISHGKLFFKFLNKAKYIGSYYLIRTLEINKEKTDERLNRIEYINNKIITILSGKWNTSISVASELLKNIK
jgi:hypothetical protein